MGGAFILLVKCEFVMFVYHLISRFDSIFV